MWYLITNLYTPKEYTV